MKIHTKPSYSNSFLCRATITTMFTLAGISCSSHGYRVPASAPASDGQSLHAAALGKADPVEDLHQSLLNGDRRFIALEEMGEFIPGAENRPDITLRFGVKWVQGASDTADKQVQDAAVEYAQIYNLLLLRYLRSVGELR